MEKASQGRREEGKGIPGRSNYCREVEGQDGRSCVHDSTGT